MYYDFTGLLVIIENTQFCTIILLRSLGIQYDNIPRTGQYSNHIMKDDAVKVILLIQTLLIQTLLIQTPCATLSS